LYCIKQGVCIFVKNQKELSLWIQNNCFHAVTSAYLFKVAYIVAHEGGMNRKEGEEGGKCFGLEDTNLPISAFNRTLSLFHKQILHQRTAGIIVPTKPPTTNYNASKPDILRQLFKQMVLNNRSSNRRQKGMPFCPIHLILYILIL
jgi:hypothetical protein